MALQLLTPSPAINYNFVAGVYGFFSLLAVVLAVAHHYSSQVEGFYIVLAPFVPCFLWSLVVRSQWLAQRAVEDAKSESKKDQ